jgi:hypothetical protein
MISIFIFEKMAANANPANEILITHRTSDIFHTILPFTILSDVVVDVGASKMRG